MAPTAAHRRRMPVCSTARAGRSSTWSTSAAQAKGQLSAESAAILQPTFAETWADTEKPTLGTGFGFIPDDYTGETEDVPVSFQVTAGEYAFAIVVALVPDEIKMPGTPLAAARASATCP